MADRLPRPTSSRIQLSPTPDGRILIRFPYDPGVVRLVKSIPGRRYHPARKCWSVPRTPVALQRLEHLFCPSRPATPLTPSPPGRPERACRSQLTTQEQALARRVEEEMKLRGYSPKTRKSYRNHLLRFYRHFRGRSLSEVGTEEIRRYLLMLVERKQASRSYHNQAINAIKLLYEKVLKRPGEIADIPRPRSARKLPTVMSRESTQRLLNAVDNLKHQTLLVIMYSAGLRVGEVVRLRAEDLDSARRLIRVRQAKGRKDRYTLLSELAIAMLKTYIREYAPTGWLFGGARPGRHLSERSVQKIVQRACTKAGIPQHVTSHTLRHYADFRFMPRMLACCVSRRRSERILCGIIRGPPGMRGACLWGGIDVL